MHVPIENILSMKDFVAKADSLASGLKPDSLYVITQNDKPVAAFVSIEHLQALTKDDVISAPVFKSTSQPSITPEKELPALPKPPLPPLSPSQAAPSRSEDVGDRPPAMPPPLPSLPKLDDKAPLVTTSEAKGAVSAPHGITMTSPAEVSGIASQAQKPPLPPIPSPFSNVSASTINPPSTPSAAGAGTTSAATWPTPTAAPKPDDADIDALTQDDDIL